MTVRIGLPVKLNFGQVGRERAAGAEKNQMPPTSEGGRYKRIPAMDAQKLSRRDWAQQCCAPAKRRSGVTKNEGIIRIRGGGRVGRGRDGRPACGVLNKFYPG